MISELILLLLMLQIKHCFIDFYYQTMEEVNHKGIYGNWLGIKHSLKHGVGTALCVWFFCDDFLVATFFGTLDFFSHYHIDYIKMRFGNRDVTAPAFWNQLGLDQLAHQITYLVIGGLTLATI